MEDFEEAPIDDVLKAIRQAIIEKERKEYFQSFYPIQNNKQIEPEGEVFELSKSMLVEREDVPYQLGVWSFDDVAKKIMRKYRNFFNELPQKSGVRVQVKEDN